MQTGHINPPTVTGDLSSHYDSEPLACQLAPQSPPRALCLYNIPSKHSSLAPRPQGKGQASPTLGRAGEGRGLFFTSIQFSESRSGKLADKPLGSVFRLLTSSVFVGTGVTARGEPGADSERWKGEVLIPPVLLIPALRRTAGQRTRARRHPYAHRVPTCLFLVMLAGHKLRAVEKLREIGLGIIHNWGTRKRPFLRLLPPANFLIDDLHHFAVLQGLQRRRKEGSEERRGQTES